jgi:hypothetical protein
MCCYWVYFIRDYDRIGLKRRFDICNESSNLKPSLPGQVISTLLEKKVGAPTVPSAFIARSRKLGHSGHIWGPSHNVMSNRDIHDILMTFPDSHSQEPEGGAILLVVISCHTCHIMSFNVTSHNIMCNYVSFKVISSHIKSYYVISCHIMPDLESLDFYDQLIGHFMSFHFI